MSDLLGRYEILEEIGRGGFAIVYRVRDSELGRQVALKELRPSLLNDSDGVERFKREARTIAQLQHPHMSPGLGCEYISKHVILQLSFHR